MESREKFRRLLVPSMLVLIASAVLSFFAVKPPETEPSVSQNLAECRRALRAGQWGAVVDLATDTLKKKSDCVPAMLMLAQAYAALERVDDAIAALNELPRDETQDSVAGQLLLASLLTNEGRLNQATAQLESIANQSAPARSQLAYILAISGQQTAARQVLLKTLSDPLPLQHLFWVAFPDSVVAQPAFEKLKAWSSNAETPSPPVLNGLANWYLSDGQPKQAIPLLQKSLSIAPDSQTIGLLGTALFDANADEQLDDWLTEHSDIIDDVRTWSIRGKVAMQRKDRQGATRAFLEAVRLDANNDAACYQAGRLLERLGQADVGQRLQQRSQKLKELRTTVSELAGQAQELNKYITAISLLADLGRLNEAVAWFRFVEQAAADAPQVADLRERLHRMESSPADQNQRLLENPIVNLNLNAFPVPLFQPSLITESGSASTISFRNVAEDAGLHFLYRNGHDPSVVVMRMHEYTGGAAAVIDVDQDQCPDLFFTQAGNLPDNSQADSISKQSDQLYRNNRCVAFSNITSASGLSDSIYGQGASVGDVNNDGFQDLYVGNIGTNVLFINNGDGTFTAANVDEFSAFRDWTSSCAMIDVNGDGMADIYDVNYLEGEDLYTKICVGPDSIPRSCKPTIFPAAADRVWLNEGDGTFAESSTAFGLDAAEGRGLGIVAFYRGDQRLPSLFIANDGEANFFFAPDLESDTTAYLEQGVATGLAFDGTGKAQACMGIAADDVSGDGETDLFVTNFYFESNTLYSPNTYGTFDDVTDQYDLRESSLPVLGFGTQFADFDLDGAADLFVANGHEGDYSDLNIPFRMAPQLYSGRTQQPFRQVPSQTAGPYFDGRYLGRGVARLDWNNDGKPDLCVTHLDDPVALLQNTTPARGAFIKLSFSGTSTARDGTGVKASLMTNDRVSHYRLNAGDGYLSSNQRCLFMSPGFAEPVDKMILEWPSGKRDIIAGPIAVNRSYVAVEGSGRLVDVSFSH